MTTEGLCPRALRAAVFTTVCALLSAVTYAAAGHGAAPVWAVLAALAILYPAAWTGAGRSRGFGTIFTVTALAQIGLDYWYTLAQADDVVIRGCGLGQVFTPVDATVNCAQGTVGYVPAGTGIADPSATGGVLHVGLLVLAVQLLVALVSALSLYQGERAQAALWRAVAARGAGIRWWPRLLLALIRLVPATGPGRVPPAGETGRIRPRRTFLAHAVVRRGPPVSAAIG